jgi:hypothetical protein
MRPFEAVSANLTLPTASASIVPTPPGTTLHGVDLRASRIAPRPPLDAAHGPLPQLGAIRTSETPSCAWQ